jgi:hypothetical protein
VGLVRYAQGGGLTDAGRAARERVRLHAVDGFERGEKNREFGGCVVLRRHNEQLTEL